MSKINLGYFEDHDENRVYFYDAKDAILDFNYPNYNFTNPSGYKYARILFCTYLSGLASTDAVHIHENILVNMFNTSASGASKNSTIQINLESVVVNGSPISGATNATCKSYKVNNLGKRDIDHKVIITNETYTDSTGNTRKGIGVWVNIDGYSCIAVEPLYSMALNNAPEHKSHFDAYYYANYMTDDTKVNDSTLVNIESTITPNQIAYGIYDNELVDANIDEIKTALSKIPTEYTQNTIYFSNTYTPDLGGAEELIAPYSVRGLFTTKIASIDSISKCISVLNNGYYAVQLHNGFYTTSGNTQLQMKVYKNDSEVKELGMYSYLEENKRNTFGSNVAILRLVKTDKLYLKLIWGDTDIIMDHDTYITLYPIRLD